MPVESDVQLDKPCPDCPHPRDPHILVPTKEDPMEGGVMICHVKGCLCIASWDVPPLSTQETVRIPDDEELTFLRGILQKEEA